MKTIKITVEVDGNSVDRNYSFEDIEQAIGAEWDVRIADMLDTISKSDVKEF